MSKVSKDALRNFLTERRARIDPRKYGYARPSKQGLRAPGLNQQQVDGITDRTPGTYQRLESGRYRNPRVEYLREIATLFSLNEQEWTSLCLYAGIGDPPGPLALSSGKEVPAVWQEAIDGQTHPAYVTDASWELVVHNQAFARLFPDGQVPRNTMRWMLLEPAGRTMLTNWDTAWAPLVLPQLRAGLAARPDDPILRQLEREVLADPDCAAIWDGAVGHIHPDGDERPLLHAEDGPGWVTMCASEPMAAPGSRHITLIFHAGEKRAPARTPVLRADPT
ncbi:helix-turn-helix transcriptional regulator [Streptomyces rubiginosohelvolus]|uniref:helix-turn-helix transcriptional regulator n=1 Tax=Streptomyces rubiginosohelvolus TaxID=67362 RepID=UPI0033DC657B